MKKNGIKVYTKRLVLLQPTLLYLQQFLLDLSPVFKKRINRERRRRAREREERETEIKRMEKNEEYAEDNEIFKHTRNMMQEFLGKIETLQKKEKLGKLKTSGVDNILILDFV